MYGEGQMESDSSTDYSAEHEDNPLEARVQQRLAFCRSLPKVMKRGRPYRMRSCAVVRNTDRTRHLVSGTQHPSTPRRPGRVHLQRLEMSAEEAVAPQGGQIGVVSLTAYDWTCTVPQVELHAHLNGSIRHQTLRSVELAPAGRMQVPYREEGSANAE